MKANNLIHCHLLFIILLVFPFSCKKPSKQSQEVKSAIEINKLLQFSFKPESPSLEQSLNSVNEALRLAQLVKNDTLVCMAWLTLGKILNIQGKNDESLSFFQKALQLSEKVSFEKGVCDATIAEGRIYYTLGQYDKAYALFKESLKIAQKNKYLQQEANSLNFIGKYFHTTGHFDESVRYYKEAIELYNRQGSTIESTTVLLSLGKTYNNDGNLYMALKCYLDAYKIFDSTSDYVNLADVCNHLGSIYLELNHPDRSLEYHRKALLYRETLKSPEGLAKSFNNIGEVFLVKNMPDSARKCFLASLYNSEHSSYLKGRVKALTNLGKTSNMLHKPKTAKQYLIQALNISKKAKYNAGVAESSLELGNTLLKLNLVDSAMYYFELCLEKAKSANLTELNHDAYLGLYQYYNKYNDIRKALAYYVLFAQSEKKLLQAENDHQLAELRITFESEKKEKDNEVLRKENELKEMMISRKNTLMLAIAIFLAFTIIFSIMLYSRYEIKQKANKRLEQLNNQIVKQNKELKNLNKELENANSEKDKLFSIIAHELRNPLYWFQNLTEVLSLRYQTMPADKVQKSLNSLDESAKNAFHLMDNLLHWSRSRLKRITPKISEQSLEKLVYESTRMYDTILQQKEIMLNVHLSKNSFIKADPDLFTCVVRNLFSNAIKFTPVKGTIEITSLIKNQHCVVSISDSGIGIPLQNIKTIFDSELDYSTTGLMNEKGSGFGLKLCKEFVELNGGRIWTENNRSAGSVFCFTVPVCVTVIA